MLPAGFKKTVVLPARSLQDSRGRNPQPANGSARTRHRRPAGIPRAVSALLTLLLPLLGSVGIALLLLGSLLCFLGLLALLLLSLLLLALILHLLAGLPLLTAGLSLLHLLAAGLFLYLALRSLFLARLFHLAGSLARFGRFGGRHGLRAIVTVGAFRRRNAADQSDGNYKSTGNKKSTKHADLAGFVRGNPGVSCYCLKKRKHPERFCQRDARNQKAVFPIFPVLLHLGSGECAPEGRRRAGVEKVTVCRTDTRAMGILFCRSRNPVSPARSGTGKTGSGIQAGASPAGHKKKDLYGGTGHCSHGAFEQN